MYNSSDNRDTPHSLASNVDPFFSNFSSGSYSGTVTVLSEQGGPEINTWLDLHQKALSGAQWLHRNGINPTDVVAILGRTSIDAIIAIKAIWLAGASVTVIALPASSRRQAVAAQRLSKLRNSVSISAVIGETALIDALENTGGVEIGFDHWRSACSAGGIDHSVLTSRFMEPRDPAIIQLTSGTTGNPKCLPISWRNLRANLRSMAKAMNLQPHRDTFVSWLPLFHDMGLIGMFALPMQCGASIVLADPSDFIRNPRNWMRWCSQYRGTVTAGPSFAYSLVGKLLETESDLDLSSLRVAANGAEQIDVDGFEHFADSASLFGLDRGAAMPVYGLAEATLGVSFSTLGGGIHCELVRERDLEHGRAVLVDKSERGRKLAILGRPLEGIEVRIRGENGWVEEDAQIGEIMVRGESVVDLELGVENVGDAEGWLATGDFGYLREEQLVLCGRSSDLIIVGGRNLYPVEIERSIGALPGVHHGNCAAVGGRFGDAESVFVVLEVDPGADTNKLRETIVQLMLQNWDVVPREVRFVAAGELPKTTSGKLSRETCKSKFFIDASGFTWQ